MVTLQPEIILSKVCVVVIRMLIPFKEELETFTYSDASIIGPIDYYL
jgi:hypothetical protein